MIFWISDDGSIKIWRNYSNPEISSGVTTEIVSAWQAITDMLPIAKAAGLVVEWHQRAGIVYSSGDTRVIRLWDVDHELKIQVCNDTMNCFLVGLFSLPS